MCFDLIDKYYNKGRYKKIITNVKGSSFPVFADKHLMEYAIFMY
jgi:hypothetical protein